jgi:1-acyl-sn-glycerol-3-phosphate acyltransferase
MAREALQRLLAFPLLRFYVRAEVHGLEKLDKLFEPALLVANHQSFFDAPVILRSLPARHRRQLAAAMSEGAFREHSRMALFWARLAFNGYLISDNPSRAQEALRHAGWLAENGYSTLIFPEGERTWDGQLMRFRPGAGVMAERLRLPVVPLLLDGLFELWPRTQYWPSRGKARLFVGDITRIRPGETPAEFVSRLESYYRAWKK